MLRGLDFRLRRSPVCAFVVAVSARPALGGSSDARYASACWPSAKLASDLFEPMGPKDAKNKTITKLRFYFYGWRMGRTYSSAFQKFLFF